MPRQGPRVDGVASTASRRYGIASTASRRRRRVDGVASMASSRVDGVVVTCALALTSLPHAQRASAIDSNLPGVGKRFVMWSHADAKRGNPDPLQAFTISRADATLRLSAMGYDVVDGNLDRDEFIRLYLDGSTRASSAAIDSLLGAFPAATLTPPTPHSLPVQLRSICYNGNGFRLETLLPALERVV